ncbi:MAG: glycosyltransferase [Candidatus Deferrimicrobiaceae bacterium]
MQKTSIIVPCCNEAGRLKGEEFIRATEQDGQLHFLFVDDGSTDGTREILAAVCRSNPSQMARVSLEKNSGKAEAVRKGFLQAFTSDYRNIGYWDADLSTPLNAITKFCEILEAPGVRLVMGSRVKLLGRKIERRALRHYPGRFYATFASLVTGLPVYDTQCGAKIFKNSEELRIVFGKPFRVNWTFDVEILARFLMLERYGGNAPVVTSSVEYPLEEWTDVKGSKVRPFDFLIAAVELCRICFFLHAPGAEHRFARMKNETMSG